METVGEREREAAGRVNTMTVAFCVDCWLKLTIREGRNRQVRRMTAAVGHPTLRLVRWGIGDWTVAGLASGEWQSQSL